jgi:Protein of unknown function (DUF3089)
VLVLARLTVLALLGLISACRPAVGADPPAPDYAQPASWAAWPGRPSGADAVPAGLAVTTLPEADKVDVFFIHPTTDLRSGIGNARYDEPGATGERIARGVLRYQASTFNGCCRIFAPHYRQATIGVFYKADDAQAQAAFSVAYGDVLRAFDYYLAHENHGRPFILASHSQGSLHALRLLQERIAHQPLQRQLIAAYVIGYYLPPNLEQQRLPICQSATATGCLIDWNTVKPGSDDHGHENHHLVWLDGRYQHAVAVGNVCVNPLTWTVGGTGAATLNLGALPAARGTELPPVIPQLTGATCNGPRLEVDIPLRNRARFSDALSMLSGSYHVFDYNIFYVNIRENALQRVRSFRDASAAR